MALYTNIYPALKTADPVNAAAIVAASAEAARWDPQAIAIFCRLIQADPVEVQNIIRQSTDARAIGVQWFVQP